MARIHVLDKNSIKGNSYYKKHVQAPIKVDTYADTSVESTSLFGFKSRNKLGVAVNEDIYNLKATIQFHIPILNLFLSGLHGEVLKRLFGNKYPIDDIANGNVFYDKLEQTFIDLRTKNSDGVLLTSSEYNNGERFLIGGNCIRYLFEMFDAYSDIEDILYERVKKCLNTIGYEIEYDDLISDYVKVTFNPDEVLSDIQIGDYYITNVLLDDTQYNAFKEVFNSTKYTMLDGLSSRLTYLFAYIRNSKPFKNMVQDYLVVLPKGFRPTVDKRKDLYTQQFDKIYKASNNLYNVMSNPFSMVSSVIQAYKRLVYSYSELTVTYPKNPPQGYKPLRERLTGKEGIFRGSMLATRIDFSGRGVISVDPLQPIDVIGIPEKMVDDLVDLEFLSLYKTDAQNKCDILIDDSNVMLKHQLACKYIVDTWVLAGRQPTLFQLGIRAFKVKIVQGSAITLSPLIVVAFNADFDGDQMWTAYPKTALAKYEVSHLMSVVNNMFLPRNGEIHIFPRQEMLYGLWKASIIEPDTTKPITDYPNTFETYQMIYNDVVKQNICIDERISINGGVTTAGRVAIRHCLKANYGRYKLGVLPLTTSGTDKEISEAWLKEVLKSIVMYNRQNIVSVISNLTELGFAIANIFPPDISIYNIPDTGDVLDEFNKNIDNLEEYYNFGFITKDEYTSRYNTIYSKLDRDVRKTVFPQIKDTGWWELVESKARGSKSNLTQLFGLKGRMKKNDTQTFNTIIPHSLCHGLTDLEHFVTAYGSREGIVDKTIETAEPGYLSRLISNTVSWIDITTTDCGTSDGIHITYELLRQFIPEGRLFQDEKDNIPYLKEYFSDIVIGRYIVGYNEVISAVDADYIFDTRIGKIVDGSIQTFDGVKLRSPLTCNCPVCSKCYGIDLGTNTSVVKGTMIGVIASGSIGEPCTQLTMRNFKSGGVAGEVNITSSFDLIQLYFNVQDMYDKRYSNGAIKYDYITPVSGEVKTTTLGNGVKKLLIMQENDKGEKVNKLRSNVLLPADAILKDYVERGDSIYRIQGDLNIKEIVNNRSFDEAVVYLTLKVYDIYRKEVFVSLKHFEVVTLGMIRYLCIADNTRTLIPGLYYNKREMLASPTAEVHPRIVGVDRQMMYNSDVFSSMIVESASEAVQRSVPVSGTDSMTSPIVRSAFGLPILSGSNVETYINERGMI